MDEWVTALLTLGIPTLTALGLFYKNVRDTQRADKKADQEQREAEQKRIEAIADRLQEQYDKAIARLDATETECASLRTQQNQNIKEIAIMSGEVEQLLKDNQSLTKEVESLRAQLLNKDKVIQEQDGRIKQQEKRIHELEDEYKRVRAQLDAVKKEIETKSVPDSAEHDE